jgi:hypothetical protein
VEFADFFAKLGPGGIGFTGLLSFAIFLILTGRLVPKSTVDDLRADNQARIADVREEADSWKDAYLLTERARGEQGSQFSVLLEYAKTADHLIRAMQPPMDPDQK